MTATASTPERLPLAAGAEVMRDLRYRSREQRALIALTVVLAVLAALAGLISPWAIGLIVDAVGRGDSASEIIAPAIWVAVGGVSSAALVAASSALVVRVGQRMLARIREDVVATALRMPPGRLEAAGRGDLLTRVGDDIGVVSQLVATVLAPWVAALLTVALTFVGLFALNPFLALAGFAAIPIYVFSLRWYLPRAAPRYRAERAAFGDRAEALVASLSGLATVRAYRAEAAHTAAITASSDRARGISREVLWFATAWGKWMNIAELVGLIAIILVGFFLVTGEVVTVGAVTAATLYFHRLFNPLGMIIFSFDEMQSAGASLQRLIGVTRERQEPVAAPSASLPSAGTLEARGITHHYGAQEVVSDVSFALRDGERVALVGASGAGKSTVAGILAGLIEPSAGEVDIGGVPASVATTMRPRPIVLVSQESHVFAGSLAEDLRLARASASEAEIERALALVGAQDWVAALPAGIDTVVGESGHRLTAEQIAQVALARAALAGPAIILLDEATAESGSRGAARLERAATAVTDGRTALVIAHRLQQARLADRVLVMSGGGIIESGTHEELLAAGGTYAELWRAYDTN